MLRSYEEEWPELTVFILHVLLLRGVGISKHLVKMIKLLINERYNGYHLNY